ncbi:MAG: hypothetical protein HY099_06645 [Nitrospirae bacterium]|nr:hypothetical protein [Nitrospirota bacterium]
MNSELTIIGFGKLGGREITFNSDLDLIFVTLNDPAAEDIKAAERLLKISMSYTKDGMAYRMDTRLRPEGSKGPLVSSIRGLEDYYLKHARTWELQALLKARPVAGDVYACRRFMDMRRNVLIRRGMAVTIDDIKRMRERINRELSRELLSAGIYDVKLGSGGLEDLEFMIQYLQIRNCQNNPGLLVQDTLAAIRRLNINGILNAVDAMMFSDIYIFYRTIETILRLRNESVLKEGSNTFKTMIDIMDTDEEIFLTSFKKRRQWVSDFWSKAGISEV